MKRTAFIAVCLAPMTISADEFYSAKLEPPSRILVVWG